MPAPHPPHCIQICLSYVLVRGCVNAPMVPNDAAVRVRKLQIGLAAGIYIYMAYLYLCTYQGAGSPGGLGVGCRDPPPILRSGNTKKHVLEVNWMVISGSCTK